MKCIICGKRSNRSFALYCDEHRSNILAEGGRKSIFEDVKKPITNGERWAIIGASSSYEALKTVYKMFKK